MDLAKTKEVEIALQKQEAIERRAAAIAKRQQTEQDKEIRRQIAAEKRAAAREQKAAIAAAKQAQRELRQSSQCFNIVLSPTKQAPKTTTKAKTRAKKVVKPRNSSVLQEQALSSTSRGRCIKPPQRLRD